MDNLKINLVSNIFNPVGPSASGGLEVFNYYLAKELENRGIEVSLFASGDSSPLKSLRPIVDKSVMYSKDKEYLSAPWNYRRMTVEEFAIYTKLMQQLQNDNGVIHFSMVNFLPIYLAAKSKMPCLVTLHMPVDNLHYQTLLELLTEEEIKSINFIGVSHQQIKDFKAPARVIHNGVYLDDFLYTDQFRDNIIWIARMVKVKGCEDAILAANQAGVDLELGGAPNTAEEQDYFDEKIAPSLNEKIRHYGYVEKQKRSEFYSAKALLFLPKWEEPFGLTMIEAMACGTPVIAYDRGAVREVILEGETGFIVNPNDTGAVAEAISKINSMSAEEYSKMRARCREHIEKNFSYSSMVDKYLEVYNKISN